MATVASHSDIAQFVPEYSAQFLGELQGILEKAQRFSGASGVAIAFVEGEELVTKSGLGASAPEVGSRSPIQGSFTGLSVQTREVQRCDDASHDSRVDGQACASIGIASMVIVPIGDKNKSFGVLAAFAPKANAFTPTHVALLRTLADIVVELYNRYPGSSAQAAAANTSGATAPKADPKPAVPAKSESAPKVTSAAATAPAPKVSAPAPKVETAPKAIESAKPKSAVPTSSIKLTEAPVIVPPVAPEPKKEAKAASAKQEPLRIERKTDAPRYAPVVDIDAGREKKEDVLSAAADIGPVTIAKTRVEAPAFAGYGNSALSAYEQREREESGSKRVLMIAAALVVVFALVAGGYLFSRKSSKPATETAKVTQPQQSTPAPVAPAQQVPETQTASAPVNTTAAPVEKVVEHVEKEKPASVKEHTPDPTPKKTERAPMMVAGGGNIPKAAPTGETVDAPSVIPASGGDVSGILGMVRTAQPKAAFKSSSVTPPELMKRVPPIYPAFARQWHLKSERVVLNATIGKDGTVTDVKLVSGKQIFVDSAMTAVRQWKYKPAYLNGEPVSASIEIDLDFTN